MTFLTSLVNKAGKKVEESSLVGKVVVLYFSSSWCPACVKFTPVLHVLTDDAKEEEIDPPLQVIYVSSDTSASQCEDYIQKKHGNDWMHIPFDDSDTTKDSLRYQLKQRYGVFAGSEQRLFPSGTKRRSGIPTLVVVGRDGTEHAILDCDSPRVIQDITKQGTGFLKQWEQYKW